MRFYFSSYKSRRRKPGALLVSVFIFALSLPLLAGNLADSIEFSGPSPNEGVYQYSESIFLRVENFQQAVKLFRWLDLISLTEIGNDTVEAINSSGNKLLIYHNDFALLSAGVTQAPMTENLINGIGESVSIKFYLDMEMAGSNCVLGSRGQLIEFTALHNLFHELSHARHKMNGTWMYFDSEGQAIREENIFRKHWAQYRSQTYQQRHEYIEDEALTLNTGTCVIANALK